MSSWNVFYIAKSLLFIFVQKYTSFLQINTHRLSEPASKLIFQIFALWKRTFFKNSTVNKIKCYIQIAMQINKIGAKI